MCVYLWLSTIHILHLSDLVDFAPSQVPSGPSIHCTCPPRLQEETLRREGVLTHFHLKLSPYLLGTLRF